jgi:hypothetical protein
MTMEGQGASPAAHRGLAARQSLAGAIAIRLDVG